MAKKYIDAEKLERHFENCICEAYNTNGVTEDFEIALKATKNQPAADVQEVRHGYWKKEKNDVLTHWHCTVCEKCYYLDKPKDAFYCPHCGARMDGDENVR